MNTFFYLVWGQGDQLEILEKKVGDSLEARLAANLDWDVGVVIATFPEQRFRSAIASLQALRIVDGHYYAVLSRNLAFYDLGPVDNFDRPALEQKALELHAGLYEQDAEVFTAAQATEILRMGLYSLQCHDQEKENDASTGTSSPAG